MRMLAAIGFLGALVYYQYTKRGSAPATKADFSDAKHSHKAFMPKSELPESASMETGSELRASLFQYFHAPTQHEENHRSSEYFND